MTIADRIKTCRKCGHTWLAVVAHPIKCPHCQSKEWDKQLSK